MMSECGEVFWNVGGWRNGYVVWLYRGTAVDRVVMRTRIWFVSQFRGLVWRLRRGLGWWWIRGCWSRGVPFCADKSVLWSEALYWCENENPRLLDLSRLGYEDLYLHFLYMSVLLQLSEVPATRRERGKGKINIEVSVYSEISPQFLLGLFMYSDLMPIMHEVASC